MPNDWQGMFHPVAPGQPDDTSRQDPWPGYLDSSTDGGREWLARDDPARPVLYPPTPPTADVVVLIDRLDTALEERDHWRLEARREHDLVEHADAALKQCKTELTEALALAETLQTQRDYLVQLHGIRARQLEAAQAMNRTQVDLIQEARAVARRLLAERDAGRGAVRILNATRPTMGVVQPVVDAAYEDSEPGGGGWPPPCG